MKALCIYHGNCADGFGAATVVRMALHSENVEFHAGCYSEPPPDVTDRDVILVAFSYKRDVLITMAKQAKNILILDHHKSAAEELVDLPSNVEREFDMSRSGAIITWDHYFPNEPPPPLLLHVQDRDLWQFKLRDTENIMATVFSYSYNFDVWNKFLHADLEALADEGVYIRRAQTKAIREFIDVAKHYAVIGGHTVPALNAPYMWASEAASLLDDEGTFACCYWDSGTARNFSLRSKPGGVDVSKVAKEYGGGGHQHSAGFEIPYNEGRLVWNTD